MWFRVKPDPLNKKGIPMIERSIKVADPIGMHARPAGQIVKLAKENGVSIFMGRDAENLIEAKSPILLLGKKFKNGEDLIFRVDAEEVEANRLLDEISNYLGN
jgi:phosphotransferase system HPr (HPr) family protein